MKKLILLTLTTVLVMAAIFAAPRILSAEAAPPNNDDFYSAIQIISLPFSSTVDTKEATTGPNDPEPCNYYYPNNSVWYRFTPPTSGPFSVSTTISEFDVVVGIYTGEYNEGLKEMYCFPGEGTYTAKLDAGVTYSFMIIGIGNMHPYPPGDYGAIVKFELTSSPPPENDDFDNAKVISGLPYNDAMDTRMATWASDDPADCWNSGSVWYAFTPKIDMNVEADTLGSDYDTTLAVYTGRRGALVRVPGCCNNDAYGQQSFVSFKALANTTYYFMVGRCCESGGSGGGQLVFNLLEQIPPENDNFADAMQIDQLPFVYEGSNKFATAEDGELVRYEENIFGKYVPYCLYSYRTAVKRSVWFKYSPRQSGSLFLLTSGFEYPVKAVYRDDGVHDTYNIGCSLLHNEYIIFDVEPGNTYYIQLGGYSNEVWARGNYTLKLDWAPPPVADFRWSPIYPSPYDQVDFFDQSQDPLGQVFIYPMMTWGFGDGSNGSGDFTTHQYSSDGDYAVSHGVVTVDGRTNSITKTVSVRTHDVGILKFVTPKLALPGQTRKLLVVIRNNNYPEEARVDLYKKTPSGFLFIESQSVKIPVSQDLRTKDVIFNYTFTDQDALMGRVTFKAVVSISPVRDVFLNNNEAISKETRIITFKTIPPVPRRIGR